VKTVSKPLKYQSIELELRKFAETLPLGAKLPSERDLAISHDCNFLTIRKALKSLVDDGSIVRRVGSGTFIAKHFTDPNASLRTAHNRIGIFVYQGSNAYAYRILQSFAHASIEQETDVRSIWVRDFGDQALVQASMLKQDGCIALALPWFPHEMVEEVRRFVLACPLPVSLPLVIPGLEKNCFEQHDIFGASSALGTMEDTCRYFQALGHQRIALLGPDSPSDPVLQRRISSYVHYTSRENLPSLCGLIAPGAGAVDQLAERWKAHRGDLAIICYDDEHALRFMTAMHKIGLNAPDDFAIIGYNDTEGSRYSDPPLTTIHQNYDYIGHWLLKNALALAHGSVCQSSKTPRLKILVRDTCGGRGKITPEFQSQFHHIDIVDDHSRVLRDPFSTVPIPAEEIQEAVPGASIAG
jgi:DNA-binding LacI/PurR family transcriptional regulator